MEETAVEKRCVPTSQQTGVRPMVMRTWQTVNLMTMRIQWMGVSPMAVGTQLLGVNSRVRTAHSYKWNSTKT